MQSKTLLDTSAAKAIAHSNIESDRARAQKESAIEALAKENHADVDAVRAMYEVEHAKLAEHARIKTFVPLITARIVRANLQEQSIDSVQ